MKKIKKAIVSVYYKDGLETIVKNLHSLGVEIYSTGGTATFIENLKIPVKSVESLTGYPEILGGRVKTLHPAVFGGLLANTTDEKHHEDMQVNELPLFDLLISNLYPFEEYLEKGATDDELIEKIDIGGVSLIRAAAKNFKDVLCVSSIDEYEVLNDMLNSQNGATSLEQRRFFATKAFQLVTDYDKAISDFFLEKEKKMLRYGENPHQEAYFLGNFDAYFEKVNGKDISYNNLLDIDAAIKTIADFNDEPTFAIFKHNNSCGLASRPTIEEAYSAALAGDPKSAFGGVLIANRDITNAAAEEINSLFFETIIAPSFDEKALKLLASKKNRIILIQKKPFDRDTKVKSVLDGVVVQAEDHGYEKRESWEVVTDRKPTENEMEDLEFGIKAVKHLKSNAIAIVKNKQLIGMGCGQPSRIDALEQAISKAKSYGFDLSGSVMASDAFFPFSDSVERASLEGITAIAQPGGSIKDQDSIDMSNEKGITMVMTGVRHFNH